MLQRPRHRDEGLTLIEVMVALLVFAIIATGVVAGLTTITRMTVDDRARVTAQNLATKDIDFVRAYKDPFTVVANTTAEQRAGVDSNIDGRVYTVKRTLSWVSSAGSDISCNASTNLFYLRINVRVTWPDMLQSTAPVQDDTIMAPTSQLSDSTTGAIAVSVLGASSDGQSGVTITVAPDTTSSSPGKTLSKPTGTTDSSGCIYFNQVPPGAYTVTMTKTGWMTSDQAPTTYVQKGLTVTAGGTIAATLPLFAKAATITTTYAPSPIKYAATATTTTSPYLPTNLQTTFTNTNGTWVTAAPATSGSGFPYTSGYDFFAGTNPAVDQCKARDPLAWPSGTSNGVALASGSRSTVAVTPGGTSAAAIPVGVVLATAPVGQKFWVNQAAPVGAGNPGCSAVGITYTYSAVGTGNPVALALPYGSWRISYGSSNSSSTAIDKSKLQVVTNADGMGVASDGTVTLDPRPAK